MERGASKEIQFINAFLMAGRHPRTMKIRFSLSRWRERVGVRVDR